LVVFLAILDAIDCLVSSPSDVDRRDLMNATYAETIDKIQALKGTREAIILAHNYQRPEVQDIADYTGDSLELSRIAAKTDAKTIVFCGVQFMAETAAMLSPEKTVLLPVQEAGCPLADMATAEQLRRAREEHPRAAIISYVNSTAAVKAESDVCCTSANAVQVANSVEADEIVFVPDRNLGQHVARHSDKEILLWPGWCPTHVTLYATDVLQRRREHPDASFMAHPECLPETLALADEIASTSGMLAYARQAQAERFIVGTEMGLIHRLQQENPGREFYAATEYLICPTMKMTTLASVQRALEEMEYVVAVPERIRAKARRALDAMLAVG
jgi:quinolinate synthase